MRVTSVKSKLSQLLNTRLSNHEPLAELRYTLAHHDAVLPLTLLGSIVGILAGLIVALFRLTIDAIARFNISAFSLLSSENLSATQIMSLVDPEHFELLSLAGRFFLPLFGATIAALLVLRLSRENRFTGLTHVLIRQQKHSGKMPLSNALVQFFAGAIALGSGMSGGREGPAIHLGAAINSKLSHILRLPHNSTRVIVACGCAAAIGASFNIPLAGVIFAIEVIMLEYTVIGFVPVIVAAVAGTLVSQQIFGGDPALIVSENTVSTDWNLISLISLGLFCAAASSLFVKVHELSRRTQSIPIIPRFLIVGIATGTIAVSFPQIMGIGYDTLQQSFESSQGWQLLLIIGILKLLVTALSSGAGIPIGVIGPSIFIGACVGVSHAELLSELFSSQFPSFSSTDASSSFYGLIGMAGVMAAVFNAPLAALVSIIELSQTAEIMLPGLIVIIIANLITTRFFGQQSISASTLLSKGISLSIHPISQALNRTSLAAVIDTHIAILPAHLNQDYSAREFDDLIERDPKWIMFELARKDESRIDTRKVLTSRHQFKILHDSLKNQGVKQISAELIYRHLIMQEISYRELGPMEISHTLEEARQELEENHLDGLYVFDERGKKQGILLKAVLDRLIKST